MPVTMTRPSIANSRSSASVKRPSSPSATAVTPSASSRRTWRAASKASAAAASAGGEAAAGAVWSGLISVAAVVKGTGRIWLHHHEPSTRGTVNAGARAIEAGRPSASMREDVFLRPAAEVEVRPDGEKSETGVCERGPALAGQPAPPFRLELMPVEVVGRRLVTLRPRERFAAPDRGLLAAPQ